MRVNRPRSSFRMQCDGCDLRERRDEKDDTTTRQAYDLLAEGFGSGFNGPLQLVAEVSSDADRTAVFKDFAAVTGDRLPLFVGAIIALGFPLLLVAFRSLVEPLTAALMNLIAAAAWCGTRAGVVSWADGVVAGFGRRGRLCGS